MKTFELEPRTRFLRLRQVMSQVGLSRSQIYKMVSRGTFPQSVMLTERSVAWSEASIDAWMASRVPTRGAP